MMLLNLIREIPNCVNKNKNKCLWYIVYLYISLFLFSVISSTPYKRAVVAIAYSKYKDTVMYKERLKHFGEKFARQSYINNREYKLFATHVTKFEKFQAAVLPFNFVDSLL